jgi:hypothetical protein
MKITFKNSEAVKYTYFNGWFNPVTMTVIFCGRMWHFDMIQKGYLEGIEEDDVFGFGEKPAPKDRDWSTIRSCAAKYNWVHFIHDEKEDKLVFYGCSDEQKKAALIFAEEANIPAVFKGEVYQD